MTKDEKDERLSREEANMAVQVDLRHRHNVEERIFSHDALKWLRGEGPRPEGRPVQGPSPASWSSRAEENRELMAHYEQRRADFASAAVLSGERKDRLSQDQKQMLEDLERDMPENVNPGEQAAFREAYLNRFRSRRRERGPDRDRER